MLTGSPVSSSGRALLSLIVVGYLVAGILYACMTPPWQAPDEPAHYNYVRYVAEQRRLPVLQLGDYPHLYLEEIKARRFPSDMSIDPLRYEFHQPPLYYLLASIVYMATEGSLTALRVFSVLLGGGLLIVAWNLVATAFPERPHWAAATTAFVAFLPMHVATSSAVNNDVLAELLLAGSVAGLMRYLRHPTNSSRRGVGLGFLIGLGLVTKMSVLVVLPIALVAITVSQHKAGCLSRNQLRTRSGLLLLGSACVVLVPWLVRNCLTYGGLDLWGLARHSQVVVGQPRTVEWLAQMGWIALLQSFVTTTFRSFWGQFGWMGVVLDGRLYLLFAAATLLSATGVGLRVGRFIRSRTVRDIAEGRLPLLWGPLDLQTGALLGLWLMFTVFTYLWYNLQFVQHQGRYLFPALIPLGLAFSAGLSEALERRHAWWLGCLCFVGALGLLLARKSGAGTAEAWGPAIAVSAGASFLFRKFLAAKWDLWIGAAPYVGMFVADFVCLFVFVVPGLS